MRSLPESWVAIDRDAGSASRGLVHHGLVAGVPIYAQDFNGIYCIGAEGSKTFVVGNRFQSLQPGLVLFVLHQSSPRDAEVVYDAVNIADLFEWILMRGGGPLPRETIIECGTGDWVQKAFRRIDELNNRPVKPHYAVHSYAVIRVKTIGDAPREGESIRDFGSRVSDAVAATMNEVSFRGVVVEGCDIEQIEYAEEISSVLVDEIVPDESDPTRERTITHWFDDRMESNDGNGTDPARYVRLKKLAESIAETPLEGEPCDEAPGGKQSWTDREHALERLTEIVQQCRLAVAKTS